MSGWDCVLLDMDGTFFDFPASERRAFFRTMREFSIAADEDTYRLYRGINRAVWRELEQGRMTHERLRPERFRRLMARLGRGFPAGVTAEQVAQFNLCRIAEGDILYDGARELWQELYRRFRVCVVTNGSDFTQLNRLRRAGLMAYTHAVVTSERAGAGKPDARMFACALEQLGGPDKRRCVMVGDSLEADILGARRFGLDTIWYRPPGADAPAEDYDGPAVSGYAALRAALGLPAD